MRVIKSRAWDETAHRMIPADDIEAIYQDGTIDFLDYSLDRGGNPEPVLRQCKPVLLQFTGLKDKNGKEIYEGDVVTVGGRYPNPVHFPEDYEFYTETTEPLEVIGDIYQNPELLKV